MIVFGGAFKGAVFVHKSRISVDKFIDAPRTGFVLRARSLELFAVVFLSVVPVFECVALALVTHTGPVTVANA